MIPLAKWRFWAWPRELHERRVLGINARNLELLSVLNPRAHYPRLDDKVLTKQLCEAQGIPVPATYVVIERFGDIRQFADALGQHQEFVVKPARGAGGRGILVIVRHDGTDFETSRGSMLSLAEVKYHLSTALSGLYSLGGRPDRAIIEQRIRPHPVFESLVVGGTPDIRILVHRYAPVMAMLRLPTRASDGRANLHQGAVGVGIDLETGRTFGGVCRGRAITVHPDTGVPISGKEVPHWQEALDIAAELSKALQMGYIGVDIVLDATQGPLVLEANARPGLAIQIANRCGLRGRLCERCAHQASDGLPAAAGIGSPT